MIITMKNVEFLSLTIIRVFRLFMVRTIYINKQLTHKGLYPPTIVFFAQHAYRNYFRI